MGKHDKVLVKMELERFSSRIYSKNEEKIELKPSR